MVRYVAPMPPTYLRAVEVAERLGHNRSTINRWATAGKLPYAIKGPGLRGLYLFDPKVIDRIAAQQKARESA